MNQDSRLQDMYNLKHIKEVWEPFILRPHAWSTHRFDDVARLIGGEHGTLLDVGCGAGHLCVALAMKMGDRFQNFTGIDLASVRINNGTIAIASRFPHLVERIELKVGNADHPLPFADASFNVVVCCAVLEHVVDPFMMMKEVARVCRPGGAIVLTVPNIGYVRHIKDLLLGRIPLTGIDVRSMSEWDREGWDGGHLHYFTKSAVTDLLAYCDFTPELWTSDGRLAKVRRWSRLLTGNLTVRARRAG